MILPEPGTIDRLGDTNRTLLIEKLSLGLTDFTTWVVQGFIVLVLVIFLLIESDMLTTKVLRFFARTPANRPRHARLILDQVTRQIRAYLIARTLINLGLGLVVAFGLWVMGVNFALPLGLFAAVTNFVPYIGQLARRRPADPDRAGPVGVDRRRPDRGGDLPRRGGGRGLCRDPHGHGDVARPERDDGADRLPVLGLPLGACSAWSWRCRSPRP